MRGVARSRARRPIRAALLLAGLLTTSACSAPDEPAATAPRSEAPTTTATPSTAPSEEPAAASPPRPMTIALAGDVHFEGALRERLRAPASALTPASTALRAADLAIVNLETSIGSGGAPDPAKRFTFSAGPAALTALAAAGVDVATMANNHALDHGRDRLPSTFRAISAARRADPSLEVIGIGQDADEAFRPAVIEVDGTSVATVTASLADQDPTADPTGAWAATDASAGIADAIDPARLLAAVRRADRAADVVVAYLHWGVQGDRCPSEDQRTLARRLVGAGADVVAGTHAHRLQGDGRLGPGYVAYGLGNFAWYSPGPTGVLTLTVRPPAESAGRARVTASQWWPAEIGADGLASQVRGSAADAFDAERAALRTCAGLGGG
ncbi:poly-gamma-glutamate synthesis protein (capsule biosynthesis protein) [Nocardioides exalbidus]|uniref:Poly-gamma-glutamate synthesis protein (Capsule biosynthesis protein) n=1 Tax=Nocardioides exalbidus TaxID=402596 RepID=A0A1H4XGI1_9ACTN|nr:CapA family protein [Nocardioides exalbidus]SED03971.1 poly-gamma-glutamate synthesis protein (capsule biosynthesis protein) [Nocardioides exalbidus]